MKKIINLIVESENVGLRTDVFVNKKESLLSRKRIKNLILKKKKFLVSFLVFFFFVGGEYEIQTFPRFFLRASRAKFLIFKLFPPNV